MRKQMQTQSPLLATTSAPVNIQSFDFFLGKSTTIGLQVYSSETQAWATPISDKILWDYSKQSYIKVEDF